MQFKLAYRQHGFHTTVIVRAGNTPGSLGLCGQLTFRNEEWQVFRAALEGVNAVEAPQSGHSFEFVDEASITVIPLR